MPLKFAMSSLEGVDPEVAKLYTSGDGGNFILTGIEGVTSKAKLDEFRNNNISLTNTLQTFEGIDPKLYPAMVTELEEARVLIEKNTGKLDEGAVNKIVESRVKTIQDTAATEKATLDGTIKTLNKQLDVLIIDGNVTKEATKEKILAEAMTDVMLRAKTVFKTENGKPVAYDAEGNKMYGADGTSELSVNGWIKSLITTSPHLFEPSVTANLSNNPNRQFTGDRTTMSPLSKIQSGL